VSDIAESYQALGDIRSAREAWAAALDLLNGAGHPLAALVRLRLTALTDRSPG
jgi:hypothetical protein